MQYHRAIRLGAFNRFTFIQSFLQNVPHSLQNENRDAPAIEPFICDNIKCTFCTATTSEFTDIA